MTRRDHNDTWLRWIIIFSAICIGAAVVRGITYALTTAVGYPPG